MKEKIKQLYKTYPKKQLSYHIKSNKKMYDYIITNTSFLLNNCKFSERIYCIINDIKSKLTCKCGKILTFKNITKGYAKTCKNCMYTKERSKKIEKTCLKKYGETNISKIKEIKIKKEQTSLKNYGVINPNKSKQIKNKIKQNNILKYGVKHPNQLEEYKQKVKNTNIIKYGVKHPNQLEEYKQKIQTTCLNKYGIKNINQSKHIKLKRKKDFFDKNIKNFDCIPLFTSEEYKGTHHTYKFKCKKCNHIFNFYFTDGFRPLCPICKPYIRSSYENDIYLYISKYSNNILQNKRKITNNKFELDFYLPNKRLGIEFNGNYWHSEIYGGKLKKYHNYKTQYCHDNNIKLIHIFEDEWVNKQKIVKNRLKSILGKNKYKIYARKCKVKEIDTKLKNKFLNKYHILGEDKSSIKLGCFYKNRLIAVMTFGKRKITRSKKINWELIRYCTIANFNCIGTAGKLLKYFEHNYNPKEIITYADRRWSQGDMYHKLGFKLSHISKPNYWYMKNYKYRLHRSNFQKHKLKDKLETFNPNLSEWKNMKNNGYDRIWDCGNYVFNKIIS